MARRGSRLGVEIAGDDFPDQVFRLSDERAHYICVKAN